MKEILIATSLIAIGLVAIYKTKKEYKEDPINKQNEL
jgi:hypothetical protein